MFEQETDPSVTPIYYRFRRASRRRLFSYRFMKPSPKKRLDFQFKLHPAGQSCAEASCFWMSPQISMEPDVLTVFLDAMPELDWIYSQRTSFNQFDPTIFRKRNIRISNTGNLVSRWVAQMALACLLAQSKRLPNHIEWQRKGFWQGIYNDDIEEQVVGILGTGNVGNQLAGMCKSLGIAVVGCSRNPKRFNSEQKLYQKVYCLLDQLDEFLASIDYLVVALPLNKDTREMIGPRELALMRPSACIISVTHAPIINQSALLGALNRGNLAFAYLDRVEHDSWYTRRRLRRIDNLVVTHNSAAHYKQKQEYAYKRFLKGVDAYIRGVEIPDIVI